LVLPNTKFVAVG